MVPVEMSESDTVAIDDTRAGEYFTRDAKGIDSFDGCAGAVWGNLGGTRCCRTCGDDGNS